MAWLHRSLTIRAKVGIIVAVTMSLAMACAMIALVRQEAERRIDARMQYLEATASVFAAAASHATAAGDRVAAVNALRGVARAPQVLYSRIETGGPRPLAEIGGGVILERDLALSAHSGTRPDVLEALRSQRLAVAAPVIDGGRRVGTLKILADNSDLGPALVHTFMSWLSVFAAVLLLAMLLTGALLTRLLRPLMELTRSARHLAQSHDYSTQVPVRRSDELGVLGKSFNEMIDAIRARDMRITRMATIDIKSGLPNRAAVMESISTAIASSPKKTLLVVAFGVERFTQVRNAIGYASANQLLARIGQRLASAAGVIAVGRVSSDVIGAVVAAETAVDARLHVLRVIDACAQSQEVDGHLVDAPVRAGYASYAPGRDDAADLIDEANIALDQVRSRQLKFGAFDADAYGDPTQTLSLMSDMRVALNTGALTLHLQPKLDLRTGEILEAESLARWTDAVRGVIRPDVFIGLAEETGAIRHLTEWAVETSIAQQKMLDAAAPGFSIAVNISGKLFCDVGFVRLLLAKIGRAGARLSFEITETAVIGDPQSALRTLELCAADGIPVAIDDYGVGLSSLDYLKRMAANELKIDKSYAVGIEISGRERVIVSSTIQLAHSLGMMVTAEGVESPEALAALQLMGCDKAQGYFIGRPMPADALRDLLAARRATPPLPAADRSTASAHS